MNVYLDLSNAQLGRVTIADRCSGVCWGAAITIATITHHIIAVVDNFSTDSSIISKNGPAVPYDVHLPDEGDTLKRPHAGEIFAEITRGEENSPKAGHPVRDMTLQFNQKRIT